MRAPYGPMQSPIVYTRGETAAKQKLIENKGFSMGWMFEVDFIKLANLGYT